MEKLPILSVRISGFVLGTVAGVLEQRGKMPVSVRPRYPEIVAGVEAKRKRM